jgi:hypothetical protein
MKLHKKHAERDRLCLRKGLGIGTLCDCSQEIYKIWIDIQAYEQYRDATKGSTCNRKLEARSIQEFCCTVSQKERSWQEWGSVIY